MKRYKNTPTSHAGQIFDSIELHPEGELVYYEDVKAELEDLRRDHMTGSELKAINDLNERLQEECRQWSRLRGVQGPRWGGSVNPETPISRLRLMVKIAAQVLRDNADGQIIRYDDADCDWHCVADDLENALSMLKEPR